SAVAALFAATGQDLGMVGTSSMAHGAITPSGDGGVQLALRLAGVEVGVLGGGTTLPYARTWLDTLGCRIPGGAFRLAQIVAAAALRRGAPGRPRALSRRDRLLGARRGDGDPRGQHRVPRRHGADGGAVPLAHPDRGRARARRAHRARRGAADLRVGDARSRG